MKKYLLFYLLSTVLIYPQDMPFHKGVNLTNWFQSDNSHLIQFGKFNKKDLERIKSLGADVIRLPINLHFMTEGAPDYTLDPLFVHLLDQVVDWAEELQINLILDNHTFDVTIPTSEDIDQVLLPVWRQMAERYKDRSALIFYEILNEPHGITDQRWNEIQAAAVDAIREIDSVHTIIVGPAAWNSYNNLQAMPVYSDTNLIYTFHFYDPFIFTHQGAPWTDPSLTPLRGVPFPYNSSMPVCPDTLRGTWIETRINNYDTEGTAVAVQNLIDIANDFQQSRNVKLFCGEFGVMMNYAPEDDRADWYGVVREYLEEKNIAWTIWDYKGDFGLFEKESYELFDYHLNIPLLNSLGLNVPQQQEFTLKPDSAGFDIYADYSGENIIITGSAITDYWYSNDPAQGESCIYWSGIEQYNTVNFTFRPYRDLSYLLSEDYLVNFYIKGSAAAAIDIRFIDTKTGESDHPWRMRYTLDSGNVSFDGTWQYISIPLGDFTEQGSWDNNTWYNPEGKFDWGAVELFEVVAEYGNLGRIELWFDHIKIGAQPVYVRNDFNTVLTFELDQNFPNPFNPSTRIRYSVAAPGAHVNLKIYDVLGTEIAELVNENKSQGNYEIDFYAEGLAGGIYFYRLQAGKFSEVKKMILLK